MPIHDLHCKGVSRCNGAYVSVSRLLRSRSPYPDSQGKQSPCVCDAVLVIVTAFILTVKIRSQKRKAQCEATNDRHTEYPMASPERYPHTSPIGSPPSSHSPREAVFSSLFPPMEGCSMIGKQLSPDIRYKRNDANWQSTVWIPTSAPLSPFPSPPHYSLHEPTSSALARNHLPILPPLRNLPPSSGSSTLPTAHALFPSSDPYPRHIA